MKNTVVVFLSICSFIGLHANSSYECEDVFAVVEFSSITGTINEGGGSITLDLDRTGNDAIEVVFNITSGTATSADYGSIVPTSLSWVTGEPGSKSITIEIIDDSVFEGAESFTVGVTLIGNSGTIGNNNIVTITINDNDSASPEVEFSSITGSVSEGGGSITLDLDRTGNDAIEVVFNIISGTATSADYGSIVPTSLSWAAGEPGSKSMTIEIIDDSVFEGPESFTVEVVLASGSGGVIGDNNIMTITINDNDAPTEVEFSSIIGMASEGDGTTTLTLDRTGDGAIEVAFNSTSGTATSADYGSIVPASLSWAKGESGSKSITIEIIDDSVFEGAESFMVGMTLVDGSEGAIGDNNMVTITINDNDPPPLEVEFSSISATVNEGGGTITLTLDRSGSKEIEVIFNSTSGTATSADYGSIVPTSLSWAEGESGSKEITIEIIDDSVFEGSETFTVEVILVSGSSGAIGDNDMVTITINDNDAPSEVEFFSITESVNEGGGNISLTLDRTGDGAIDVALNSTSGTATSADYGSIMPASLSWAEGESGSKEITIEIIDDNVLEGSESFTVGVVLVGGSGGAIGENKSSLVTIIDNDAPITGVNYIVTSLEDQASNAAQSGTFRWAIQESNATLEGVDTITFSASFTSSDTVFLDYYDFGDLMLNISQPVVIKGRDVVIYANIPGRIIQINQGARIEELQFMNALNDNIGAAMDCSSVGDPIYLYKCQFKNNRSIVPGFQGRGAAILQSGGEVVVEECHFENNLGNLNIGSAISTEGIHQAGEPNFKITLSGSAFMNNVGAAPVFIGCHADLFLVDGSIDDIALATGCDNLGLQGGSINLEETFEIMSGVILSIILQQL